MRLSSRVLIAAVAFAACAGPSGVDPAGVPGSAVETLPSTTSATETTAWSVYGGDAVVGIASQGAPRILNPLLDGPDTAVLDLIAPAVMATGYDVDPVTGSPVPDVLEEVATLSSGLVTDNRDGTIDVELTVAEGARWEDGTAITASDLQFTYEIATDPLLPIRQDVRNRYARITPGSLQAEGRTLSFRMEASPDVELLFGVIVPRHQVEGTDFAADWNDRMWLAGGPFRFEQWEPGQFLELTRNPEYWKVREAGGGSLPFLDRVVFRFFEQSEVADPRILDWFQSKSLDVVWFADEDGSEFRLDGAEIETALGSAWELLAFQFGPGNRNEESLNRHLQFRRAVATAIDVSELADQRGTAPLASALRMYAPGLGADPWSQYAYDPEAVTALLFEVEVQTGIDTFAGGGPKLVLTTNGADARGVTTAGLVVESLRQNGFAAELQLEEPSLFFGSTFDNGTWDVALLRFAGTPGTADAVGFVETYDPDGLPFVGTNYFRWGTVDSIIPSGGGTGRYRDLVSRIRTTADPTELNALLVEAEQILANQVVLIPLIVSGRVGVAYWPDAIQGPAVNPLGGPMWNVEAWRRVDG